MINHGNKYCITEDVKILKKKHPYNNGESKQMLLYSWDFFFFYYLQVAWETNGSIDGLCFLFHLLFYYNYYKEYTYPPAF